MYSLVFVIISTERGVIVAMLNSSLDRNPNEKR